MRRQTSAIYIIVAVVLILVFGLLGRAALPLRWLLVMGVLVGLLVALGREVTGSENEVRLRSGRTETRFSPGRIDGVLIDPRHKISLSRLQLILWTVIVLSAWATLALHRTIPVLQGRLAATGAPLVESIAGVLAGGQEAGEEQAVRAAAIVEQLTGVAPDAAGQTEAAAYDALDIEIPQEVLLALGISLASLAGSGVIKANQATNEDGRAQEIVAARQERAAREVAAIGSELEVLQVQQTGVLETMSDIGLETMDADPQAMQRELDAAQVRYDRLAAEMEAAKLAATRANERIARLEETRAEAVGDLHTRASSAEARWSDMLRGDTIANFEFIDLGKLQMFIFTIILVFAYASLIWSIMSMPMASQVLQLVPSLSLPGFSDSLVVTMALSHGGYLATKATV